MTQARETLFVWCGHALRPNVPQDIAAAALLVAVGDAAFFANPRCYNEMAVAVYERTPVLLCLAPGVEPAPWFVAMLQKHPVRTVVMDTQQNGPRLAQRVAQIYAAWVEEEPQVHQGKNHEL